MNWVLGSPLGNSPDAASFLNNTYAMTQESDAAYAQANFGGEGVRGNFGVRFVHTDIDSTGYNYSGTPTYPPPAGSFQTATTTHNNTLPSFNIAWDVAPDVVLRGAAAEVIAWAPYNQEVHNTFLNDTVLTGSGGNASLDPYKSVQLRSLGRVVFRRAIGARRVGVLQEHPQLHHHRHTHRAPVQHHLARPIPTTYQRVYVQGGLGNCDTQGFCDYSVLRPLNGGKATVKGFTLNYQQPFGDTGFGLYANYTFADGSTKSGQDLPYNSKNAYNISPYYEQGPVHCAHHLWLAQSLPRRRLRRRRAAGVGRRLQANSMRRRAGVSPRTSRSTSTR